MRFSKINIIVVVLALALTATSRPLNSNNNNNDIENTSDLMINKPLSDESLEPLKKRIVLNDNAGNPIRTWFRGKRSDNAGNPIRTWFLFGKRDENHDESKELSLKKRIILNDNAGNPIRTW